MMLVIAMSVAVFFTIEGIGRPLDTKPLGADTNKIPAESYVKLATSVVTCLIAVGNIMAGIPTMTAAFGLAAMVSVAIIGIVYGKDKFATVPVLNVRLPASEPA